MICVHRASAQCTHARYVFMPRVHNSVSLFACDVEVIELSAGGFIAFDVDLFCSISLFAEVSQALVIFKSLFASGVVELEGNSFSIFCGRISDKVTSLFFLIGLSGEMALDIEIGLLDIFSNLLNGKISNYLRFYL